MISICFQSKAGGTHSRLPSWTIGVCWWMFTEWISQLTNEWMPPSNSAVRKSLGLFPFAAVIEAPATKWRSVPLWLLTRARPIKDLSMYLPTFTGILCLLLFPKSWDRSTVFDPCPYYRMMKVRLCEDTTEDSKVVGFTEGNMASTEPVQREKAKGTTALWACPSKVLSLHWSWTMTPKRALNVKPNLSK